MNQTDLETKTLQDAIFLSKVRQAQTRSRSDTKTALGQAQGH